MLDSLITSKTRVRLLIKFFVNAANSGYLRGLSVELNESTNAIRKELNHLSQAGYLIKSSSQNKIAYQANTKHPMFSTMRKIVHQFLGLETIVETVLERMGHVKRILVIGDYAKGIDSGNIEVVVEGDELNTDYIKHLSSKLKDEIDRQVQFLITSKYSGEGLLVYHEK